MISPARAAHTAHLGSAAYGLLAAVYRQPNPEAWIEWGDARGERVVHQLMRGLPSAQVGISLRRLIQAAKSIREVATALELIAEYNRLFSPTPRVRVPLWASAYSPGDDKVMGRAARLALQSYRQAGLAISPEVRECPDHLVIQLEFMAELCAQEEAAWGQRDADLAMNWAGLQRQFQTQQLGPWVTQSFLPRLAEHAGHRLYSLAGSALFALVSTDLAAREAPAGERALPARKASRAASRIEIRVASDPCTLCGLCTQNCQPGALALDFPDHQVRLVLTSELCTGCRLCQPACPEGALTVSPGPAQQTSGTSPRVLAEAEMAACSRCGVTLAPYPMFRTRKRLGSLNTLCPSCQIGAGLPVGEIKTEVNRTPMRPKPPLAGVPGKGGLLVRDQEVVG